MAPFVPSRPDLEALLARGQGDLRDEPYRLLLLAIGLQARSGVLTLSRGPLEKEIVFDSGTAIDCQSNIATETLVRFLVSSGRLSEGQSPDALPDADLTRAILQNLGRKLLEPFSWTQGTWQFSDEAPPVEATHRVRVPQLLVTGIVKVEPSETIESALQDAGATPLSLGSSPLFDAGELRLSEEQQKVLNAIRGGATLDQFDANEDVQRFVCALLLLGIAAPAAARAEPFFELDLPAEAPRSADTPLSAGFQPAAPPPFSRQEYAPPDEVLSAYANYREKDAFDLLALDTAAGAIEINRAFVRAAERFLPSRYEEEIRHKAQELLLASARAYAELADPMRRQALVDRRTPRPAVAPTPPTPAAPPPLPRPPKPTSSQRRRAIIDPEQLYREGRAAAAAGRLRDALGYYEMAADCDAQNGAYAAEAAYARYQLLISPAATTVKALKNAIRIDPRCGVAYLYLGKIQEALGNHVEAQGYLGRAATLGAR